MKNIIITGAAGNLGKAVSVHFLKKKYRVIALVRDAGEAEALSGSVDLDAANLQVEALDLTDEQAVEAVSGKVIRDYGNIDAALLLAGGFAMGNIHTTSMQDIKSQLAINFETAYPLARHIFRHMLEKGSGRLVFVGTRPALKPADGKNMIAYALSKSLLFNLSEQLNEEAAGTNVVSSVIVPSTIDTPANRAAMPKADFDKWVKSQQIAELLHLICSETGAPLRETVLKIYGHS
ncbi:short-subunit dehydrogenase [Anseongella ginsenosidimutans]|uniref:Short-subunit dehydrogenase n=1 Tax=Anseongella ginsenosidimutans TaxID=496056 RepID=A0A4V2UU88_9SPHI|nr:SDR family NAD(P)-dependent oxidoreductase [Anseongella ginsenosidimutans]QEC51830.1 SDR family NAD(P)-dependent oxidoreductase [Anseongella ginsenosidimutans]TCS89203.1 short-subunit dehydrogenase [Anseongella ginsenosidimutans]